MLDNPELFYEIEDKLIADGTIADFEKENGRIKGRMMITLGEVPPELGLKIPKSKDVRIFICSFDFYEMALGIALNTKTLTAVTDLWLTPQVDDAEEPSMEWVDFFINTLIESISDDGSFSVPIFSFVNDECDLTLVGTI